MPCGSCKDEVHVIREDVCHFPSKWQSHFYQLDYLAQVVSSLIHFDHEPFENDFVNQVTLMSPLPIVEVL